MSIDFRGLRPRSDDPLVQVFTELQKKFAKFITAQQTELIDSDNEDIYTDGQDMDSVIKYHSELSSQTKFTFDKKYYPAGDAILISCWLRSMDLGNAVKDRSGHNNQAVLHGDPTLVDGTLDLGIMTQGAKSIARRMNRPSSDLQNQEWISVPDAPDVRIASLTVGISIFVRFRLLSLDDQGGRAPTIFEKIEDASATNAMMLQAKSDGRLIFVFKNGGTLIAKESALPTVVTGAVYDVWMVFDEADDSIHGYKDGVELTLEDFTGNINWQSNTTDYDLQIFRRGPDEEEGFVYGDFYDYKIYQEYVVSDLDVQRHFINKWTISDIPFGQVMITNYWSTFGSGGGGGIPPVICSFSPVSFSPISFNVCVSGSGGGGGVPGDAFDDSAFDPASYD